MINKTVRPMGPEYDPWDPIHSLTENGEHQLTSIEITVTHMCNLRCEHCAVGELLTNREGPRLPLSLLFQRLDEVPGLRTLSLTGGEPSFQPETVDGYVLPLLQYARRRGLKTQVNTNLTLDLERYLKIVEYTDVLHISFNYLDANDFHQIAFHQSDAPISLRAAEKVYARMVENIAALAGRGVFVSAETILSRRTIDKAVDIHRLVAELGARRHEIHPLYPSDFARTMPLPSLQELRKAVRNLVDHRDERLWILFGTLPFFACSGDPEDVSLVERLLREPMVTIRNDPDGRNRLNVNSFTGDVVVQDFNAIPPCGNVLESSLLDIYARWKQHERFRNYNCQCLGARCTGPNLIVADTYYRGVKFLERKAKVNMDSDLAL